MDQWNRGSRKLPPFDLKLSLKAEGVGCFAASEKRTEDQSWESNWSSQSVLGVWRKEP